MTAAIGGPFFVALVRRAQDGAAVTCHADRRTGRGDASRSLAVDRASGPVRARRPRRAAVRCRSSLSAVVIVVFCWSISVGDFPIPIRDVVATLFGGGTDDTEFIVEHAAPAPRLAGVLVGAAFGMSGAIFQALVRNPLASPDIIGFNAGAALGARWS